MITQDERGQATTKQECFLCTLDPHPCSVTQLEGRIIAAYEFQVDGEMTPYITLNLGTELASLSLTRYYRSLVKGLRELGDDMHKRKLTLRVYHLPAARNVTEHKGRKIHRYRANPYTLAVLEADTLLNITDLNQAEYCPRQYLLNRLVSMPQSAAAIRGNLVHYCFKELLKEHDRGELMAGHAANGEESPLTVLYRHLDQALERSSIELALANVSPETIRAEVAPHLESLATWYANQRASLWDMPTNYTNDQTDHLEEQHSENLVRAETFLLAPEIGLRGRLDLLWQQTSRQRLLELKTGGAKGELPQSAHRWQVRGYHALLTVRRDPRMKKALATLLYSGTPGEAQAFGIPFTIKELQRVNETRNTLALSHITGIPPIPPGPSRCTKCAMLNSCQQISSLLNWQPPEPDTPDLNVGAPFMAPASPNWQPLESDANVGAPFMAPALPSINHGGRHEWRPYISDHLPSDQDFFAKYYNLLQLEGREAEKQQALLWKESVDERVKRGVAISNLQSLGKPEPTGQGEWRQTFRCTNESELRDGDEILLSDGDPITGEVVTGNIVSISAEQVTVWSPELISHPTLIDRYDTNIVHVRTLQNLQRWLKADPHLRELVAGTRRPQFDTRKVSPRVGFNKEQNLAVERAMQMQDYLLIHGPPGTGKTSVIAEIVKRLSFQGQRIMLAAFTNQAIDNMLIRLDKEGFHNYIRLGHERNVEDSVKPHLLKNLIDQKIVANAPQDSERSDREKCRGVIDHARPTSREHMPSTIDTEQPITDFEATSNVREVLRKVPVIASTTATWSSDTYTLSTANGAQNNHEDTLLQFDVAIIDEAGQLTIPAILGALRFAKRFILVGDEKQLPPLVLSKEAIQQGLADSLFSFLKRLDADYMKEHTEATSACVPLQVQYRMNWPICNFASQTFYEGKLVPHASVAQRMLEVTINEPWNSNQLGPYEAPSILPTISPATPIVFLDVRGEQEGGAAKISGAEAHAVREVVIGLLARGIAPRDIGIIAPYRAQVANLRRHLLNDTERSRWEEFAAKTSQNIDITELSIDTVDRFQGGERQVIILSFATTHTPEAESQLRDHLTNLNRLNVALTRAQRKLILVGCVPALEELPIFQRLITYCRRLQTVISYSPGM